MYNCDFKMEYKEKNCNKLYQKDLLKAFDMEIFDNKILIQKINVLFNIFNKDFSDIYEKIKEKYKMPFILDDFTCFQVLFSWENLIKTHEFLELYFKQNITNKDIILKHLLNL